MTSSAQNQAADWPASPLCTSLDHVGSSMFVTPFQEKERRFRADTITRCAICGCGDSWDYFLSEDCCIPLWSLLDFAGVCLERRLSLVKCVWTDWLEYIISTLREGDVTVRGGFVGSRSLRLLPTASVSKSSRKRAEACCTQLSFWLSRSALP